MKLREYITQTTIEQESKQKDIIQLFYEFIAKYKEGIKQAIEQFESFIEVANNYNEFLHLINEFGGE